MQKLKHRWHSHVPPWGILIYLNLEYYAFNKHFRLFSSRDLRPFIEKPWYRKGKVNSSPLESDHKNHLKNSTLIYYSRITEGDMQPSALSPGSPDDYCMWSGWRIHGLSTNRYPSLLTSTCWYWKRWASETQETRELKGKGRRSYYQIQEASEF